MNMTRQELADAIRKLYSKLEDLEGASENLAKDLRDLRRTVEDFPEEPEEITVDDEEEK